jgi:hypothetical protein
MRIARALVIISAEIDRLSLDAHGPDGQAPFRQAALQLIYSATQ